MSCACGDMCGCEDTLQGYPSGLYPSGLAGVTADAAASQVTTRGVTSSGRAAILASARAGQMLDNGGMPAYIPGSADCKSAGGQQPGNLRLVQAGTGLALSGFQVAVSTGVIATSIPLAPFTMGVSALVGLFSIFMQHHAQAVAREQSVLCSAVPAANNYLQVIEQGVQSGAVDPQHGIDALNSLLGDFQSAVSSIASECNAGCVMTEELHAIVLVKQGEYQDMLSAASPQQAASPLAPPAPSSPSVVASRPNTVAASGTATPSSYASFYSGATPAAASSLPSWLPIAAVALAGFLFVRS